jgi:hypothetical protein
MPFLRENVPFANNVVLCAQVGHALDVVYIAARVASSRHESSFPFCTNGFSSWMFATCRFVMVFYWDFFCCIGFLIIINQLNSIQIFPISLILKNKSRHMR